VTIFQSPQVAFRGSRLSVASVISGFFAITDVKVGKDSQFAAAGQLPASSFSELAVGDNFILDTCPVGNQIAITVQNLDAANAHDFRATLFGKSVLLGPKC
jgi:hypothetical protein